MTACPRNERDANSAGTPFSLLTFFWALQKKVRLNRKEKVNP